MACPTCGNPVLHSCWHPPDDDVPSVEMELARALELAEAALGEAANDYEVRVNVVLHLAGLAVAGESGESA